MNRPYGKAVRLFPFCPIAGMLYDQNELPYARNATLKQLTLPPAPQSLSGPVKAWSEPVFIDTYLPSLPDKNPMFLEKRVYQGSSGKVYPLPVIDSVSTSAVARSWQALHIEIVL